MGATVVSATIQGIILSATSNLLAQTLQSYRSNSPLYQIDFTQLFQFVLFAILNTPPNFLWGQFLEDTFPAYTVKSTTTSTTVKAKDGSEKPKTEIVPEKSLNIRNTAIKFFLDQSVGAVFNNTAFVGGMAALKGASFDEVVRLVKKNTIPLMMAGYKLWPLVSLLNFTVVPFEYRMIFGGLVGIGWGIFLSLLQSK